MKLRTTKLSILCIFNELMIRYKKTYCWPSRKKILDILDMVYGIKITLSCLDQHLGELMQSGYIKSYRNYGRNSDGTIFYLPSNRQLTVKAIWLLMKFRIKMAAKLLSWVKRYYAPKLRIDHSSSEILPFPDKNAPEYISPEEIKKLISRISRKITA